MARNVGMWCAFLVLCVVLTGAIVTAALTGGALSTRGSGHYIEKTTTPLASLSSWNALSFPCPWNKTWCVIDDPPVQKYRILVDLGHAERIKIDGITSSNLDKSSNSRIFDWQDWAKDMRKQGYEVKVLTRKPVTTADLVNTDLFIVAQPDKGKSGPVYFTKDEKEAIACFILRGNTLLVMAQQFMGGKDRTTYTGDMKSTYASADVTNDLLEGIHVEGRFTEGTVQANVLDMMDSEEVRTQVFTGTPPDIWLPAGNLKPEMKPNTFAYFHGLSIVPDTVDWLVRADSTTFTSPKNTKYSPVVQPEGSQPVAIGVNGLGCGRVYLYGDPSAWQKDSYIGKVYSETKYHEQEAARVLVSRMLSFNRTCEPCEVQAQQQAPTQAVSTRTRVTPYIPLDTVTPTPCIPRYCWQKTPDRLVCYDEEDFPNFVCTNSRMVCELQPDGCGYICRCAAVTPTPTPTASTRDCTTCIQGCASTDKNCFNRCQSTFKNCDCNECIAACKASNPGDGGTRCESGCTKPDGSSCVSSGGDCNSCVDTCVANNPTDLAHMSSVIECIADTCGVTGNGVAPNQKACVSCARNSTGSPGYARCIKNNGCSCPNTQQICALTCPEGLSGRVEVDKSGQCVQGIVDAASCNSACSTNFGVLDICDVCWCKESTSSNPCSQTIGCRSGTATLVNGICTCQDSTLPDSDPRSIQQSSCLDCYQKCRTSSTNAVILNSCQKNCNTQFKTTLAACACAGTQCGDGEYKAVLPNLTCACNPVGQFSSTMVDLSSQWNEHREGSPVSPSSSIPGQDCHQECEASCYGSTASKSTESGPPPGTYCCMYKTVCP